MFVYHKRLLVALIYCNYKYYSSEGRDCGRLTIELRVYLFCIKKQQQKTNKKTAEYSKLISDKPVGIVTLNASNGCKCHTFSRIF